MNITKTGLTEALTGFRLGITRHGHGPFRGEVAEPEVVADVLHATLSRITAERAADPAPDVMVAAVLDVIAPYSEPLPGYPPVRVPVFLMEWDGQVIVPAEKGVRAVAEQIVTAIRTASGPSPLEAAAAYFAETWDELSTMLPDSYNCHLNCAEAEALAGLMKACGRPGTAVTLLAEHAAHDTEGDQHYQVPS